MAITTAPRGTALVESKPVAKPVRISRRPVTRSSGLSYVMKRQAVQTSWVVRTVDANIATVKLIASGRALSAAPELMEMQLAILKQLQQMGQDWIHGLAGWAKECAEIKAANTMSKMVEQEFNLAAQFSQLLNGQATDLVNLMESAQIGYGYWVQEKLNA